MIAGTFKRLVTVEFSNRLVTDSADRQKRVTELIPALGGLEEKAFDPGTCPVIRFLYSRCYGQAETLLALHLAGALSRTDVDAAAKQCIDQMEAEIEKHKTDCGFEEAMSDLAAQHFEHASASEDFPKV